MEIRFCSQCGGPMTQQVPPGDDHPRAVCSRCGFVHYLNPKMVVGCIPRKGDQILMCRRNIEPARGRWTLPAGYLENGETVADGAARETLEETRAVVEIQAPYRLFNIPHVNQIYLMFIAGLTSSQFGPTSESTDVRLFSEHDVPWDRLAFTVIRETLTDFFKDGIEQPHPFRVRDISPDTLKVHTPFSTS